MPIKLKYQAISSFLKDALLICMQAEPFQPFVLVGGTAISLYRGHRMSVDIDLFTDLPYGSIDFTGIESFIKSKFSYVDSIDIPGESCFKSYNIGSSIDKAIKLDIGYTEPYIEKPITVDGIRISSLKDLIAMKLDVILRGGRKKDFWDINELKDDYNVSDMLHFHREKYPYAFNEEELLQQMKNFIKADEDFDPICLKGQYWELIKLDIFDFVSDYLKGKIENG